MKFFPVLLTFGAVLSIGHLSAQCNLAINLLNAELVCIDETNGSDEVTLNIPFTGTDPNFMTTVTVSDPPGAPQPIVGGDDPATDDEGFIRITNMFEGTTYFISLMGDNCNFGTLTYEIPDGTCGPLPVSLRYFSGRTLSAQSAVNLQWATSLEVNSAYFRLERSDDQGRSFQPISELSANGNSQLSYTYQWLDPSPRPGDNFYRLQQYDLDGSFTTYGPIHVQLEAHQPTKLILFPNPAADYLTVRRSSDVAGRLELWSAQGQLLRTVNHRGQTEVPMDITGLTAGSYQLVDRTDNGQLHYERVLIMR